MRIGIIAHLKHPIGEPFAGGLETHTHLIAASLRQRGHHVTVFASTHSDPKLGLEAVCDETNLDGVGVEEAPDIAFFREHHAYLSLLNDLRVRDFDVIHNNSLHYLPVAMADALPMPMITTLHTPPFCWLESGVRVARGDNNSFIGISESIRASWSGVTTVDRVILNGIELNRFRFAPRPSEAAYLIWYGRIVPEKGLHLAIDAARQVGLPLHIAGPRSDVSYFDTEIAPRLGPGAVYLGHLDHAALVPVIGGARAFLCTPCWEEPYGLVVAEALACGVPVAAFARGAIPEILTAECGALARDQTAESLASAAQTAVHLSRRACRARAEAMCDAEKMIEAYERLYEECVFNRQTSLRSMRDGVPSARRWKHDLTAELAGEDTPAPERPMATSVQKALFAPTILLHEPAAAAPSHDAVGQRAIDLPIAAETALSPATRVGP